MNLFLIGIFWILAIFLSTSFIALYIKKTKKSEVITALYVLYIAMAQILAAKLVQIGDFAVPAAVLIFPFTFQLTDTMNEHFGQKATHQMILIAFVSQILFVIFVFFGNELEPAAFWTIDNNQWLAIFSQTFGITAASWISYLVTENLDAVLYNKIRGWTQGKHLWIRNVLSDIPSLALDSVIFITLGFGILSPTPAWSMIGTLIINQMLLKWFFGVIDTPFMYLDRFLVGQGLIQEKSN